MNQIDLLNLGLSVSSEITSDFAQIITITFAMVICIYYFLNQAKLGMKLFAFIAYSIGMFMYYGMMVSIGNVGTGVIGQLSAIPEKDLTRPTAHYLGVHASWVAMVPSVLINLGFLVLWLGVAWLLFFWKKAEHLPREVRE